MTSDRLQRIYDMQEELQRRMPSGARLGQWYLYVDDPVEATRLTKELVLAMLAELGEVLEWLNWKPWKRPAADRPNVEELRVELVDLQHFLVNLFMLWGLTPEALFEAFEAKHRENVRRQVEGY